MRSRGVLAAAWLVATLLATLIAFTATHVVGDVVRGNDPVGEAFDLAAPPSTRPPRSAPQPATKAFSTAAGQMTVTCTGRIASLDDVTPAPGWSLTEREDGPDEDVDVTLTRATSSIVIEVYCNQGQPRAVIDDGVPTANNS